MGGHIISQSRQKSERQKDHRGGDCAVVAEPQVLTLRSAPSTASLIMAEADPSPASQEITRGLPLLPAPTFSLSDE